MKSIFISHVHEDNQSLKKILKWEEEGLVEGYTFISETEDKRNEGTTAISDYIKNKINGCSCVLVLIGNDTHNHLWITKEIEYANSYHKQIICMRINGTTGDKPTIVKNEEVIVFNPNKLVKLLK